MTVVYLRTLGSLVWGLERDPFQSVPRLRGSKGVAHMEGDAGALTGSIYMGGGSVSKC